MPTIYYLSRNSSFLTLLTQYLIFYKFLHIFCTALGNFILAQEFSLTDIYKHKERNIFYFYFSFVILL